MSKSDGKTQDGTPGMDRPINRSDIEDRLRALRSDIENVKQSTLGLGIAAGGILLLLVVLLAFMLGKRRGKKKMAFIEIRRV